MPNYGMAGNMVISCILNFLEPVPGNPRDTERHRETQREIERCIERHIEGEIERDRVI